MTYRSIDLFAGIGGIRLGFEEAFDADIETVFVSEWNKYSNQTYLANFTDPFPIVGDITEVPSDEVPDHDILLAGFPCQPFSIAGVSPAAHCFTAGEQKVRPSGTNGSPPELPTRGTPRDKTPVG